MNTRPVEGWSEGHSDKSEATSPRRKIVLTPASEIVPEPVVWAWEDQGYGRIPAGALTVAAGREGTGKSSFGIWLAAQITRGVLPGSFHSKPRAVIYGAVEDSWKHTLVPRLMAAGADLTKVYRIEVQVDEDEFGTLVLPSDILMLEKAIRDNGVALVVLDPLMSTIGAGIDTHRERDTRTALDPLARLADRTHCMVLGIAHFSKGTGSDASSLITGSGAFKNVPRAVFGFAVDDSDDNGYRVMTQTKNSLGRSDLPSLLYQIEDQAVPTPTGDAHVGRLVWLGETDRTVEAILAERGSDPETAAERLDAAKWLASYLADNGGEAETIDVLKAGEKVGFSKDALKRAKSKAGVVSRKESMDAGWMWVLDLDPKGAKGAKSAKGGSPREPLPSPLPSGHHHQDHPSEGSEPRTPSRSPHPSLPSLPSLPSDGDDCPECHFPADSADHDRLCLGGLPGPGRGDCDVCGTELDLAMVRNGETTHPSCEAAQ
jgi:KaiC/GvpD/RAD55 family RecA-like ATPase